MPSADFAALRRLLARLETLFFSQLQPELIPLAIPLQILLPTPDQP